MRTNLRADFLLGEDTNHAQGGADYRLDYGDYRVAP